MNDYDTNRIVDAVLHEGYRQHPYRPSVKSVRRWTYGGLYPQVHSAAQDHLVPFEMRTEVLLEAPPGALIRARVRFLQVEDGSIGRAPVPGVAGKEAGVFPRVESLDVSGLREVPWQEGLKRDFLLEPRPLGGLSLRPSRQIFLSPAQSSREFLRDDHERIVGDRIRSTASLSAELELSAEPVERGVRRLTFRVSNRTRMTEAADGREAERGAFLSTHVLLQTDAGRFFSVADPPPEWTAVSRALTNLGNWPVLLGPPGSADTILGSPLLLPDHPRIAPEIPGVLTEGAQKEEILSFRSPTLAPAQMEALARVDPRARGILERTRTSWRSDRTALEGTWRSQKEVPRAR